MKFIKELHLKSVPEWRTHYVNYDSLRSHSIKASLRSQSIPEKSDSEKLQEWEAEEFWRLVDGEVEKVEEFLAQQISLFEEIIVAFEENLSLDDSEFKHPSFTASSSKDIPMKKFITYNKTNKLIEEIKIYQERSEIESSQKIRDESIAEFRKDLIVLGKPKFSSKMNENEMTKNIILLYISIQDLIEYREINRIALERAVRKFGSETDLNESERLQKKFNSSPLWVSSLLDSMKVRVGLLFARIAWGEEQTSSIELLEMISIDYIAYRRSKILEQMLTKENTTSAPLLDLWTFKPIPLICAFTIFFILLSFDLSFIGENNAQKCFAMLSLVIILWVTEAIPLFATSFLIPFLTVILQLLPELPAPQAAQKIVGSMMSHVILLIIGGFSIASALNKLNLDNALATFILSFVGSNPSKLGFGIMVVGLVLSTFISNLATPIICLSVLSPIFKSLPENSTYRKGLLLAIAFSSNIGGAVSPISSPQNIVAVQSINHAFSNAAIPNQTLSFGSWILISFPLCFLLLVLSHFFLFRIMFKIDVEETPVIHFKLEKLDAPRKFTVFVSLLTVFLWCIEPTIEQYTGPAGMIAIIPIVLFYGSGILTKSDFSRLPWQIVFLVAGGIALSTAVKDSNLLDTTTKAMRNVTSGQPLWVITTAFTIFIAISTSLISHTVGAMIILPVVSHIYCSAEECDIVSTKIMVMCCTFMCSGAMMLPISSFPNMAVTGLTNEAGKYYIKSSDMTKSGGPFTIVFLLAVISLGYLLSSLVFSLE